MSFRNNFVLRFIPKIGAKAIKSDIYSNLEFYMFEFECNDKFLRTRYKEYQ